MSGSGDRVCARCGVASDSMNAIGSYHFYYGPYKGPSTSDGGDSATKRIPSAICKTPATVLLCDRCVNAVVHRKQNRAKLIIAGVTLPVLVAGIALSLTNLDGGTRLRLIGATLLVALVFGGLIAATEWKSADDIAEQLAIEVKSGELRQKGFKRFLTTAQLDKFS